MDKPIVTVIEHSLGKREALRRIREGIDQYRGAIGAVAKILDESWVSDDCLHFKIMVMNKVCEGTITVESSFVRLEVVLPGIIGLFARKILASVNKKGQLLLGNR